MAPPLWVKKYHFHENLLRKVICYFDSERKEESMTLLKFREPVNIAMCRLYQKDILVRNFGYQHSFYNENSPNIAVYCQTPCYRSEYVYSEDLNTTLASDLTSLLTPPILKESNSSTSTTTPSRTTRRSFKKGASDFRIINVLNVIGVALDDRTQPDFIHLSKLSLENRVEEYRRMIDSVFLKVRACSLTFSRLILCGFGIGAFSSLAPSLGISVKDEFVSSFERVFLGEINNSSTSSLSSSPPPPPPPLPPYEVKGEDEEEIDSQDNISDSNLDSDSDSSLEVKWLTPNKRPHPSDSQHPLTVQKKIPLSKKNIPIKEPSPAQPQRRRLTPKMTAKETTSSSPSSSASFTSSSSSPTSSSSTTTTTTTTTTPTTTTLPPLPAHFHIIFNNFSSLHLPGAETRHQQIEDTIFSTGQEDLNQTLFINAWDPFSLVGNGNANDPSLDGYFGRMTAMSVLCWPVTNPYIQYVPVQAHL